MVESVNNDQLFLFLCQFVANYMLPSTAKTYYLKSLLIPKIDLVWYLTTHIGVGRFRIWGGGQEGAKFAAGTWRRTDVDAT